MKFNFFKTFLVLSLCLGIMGNVFSYAATPIAQQAYYDTFTFKVNGIVQYISDMTKKPFIANSRTYVPISTLNDLGIAKVEWIPQNGNIPAELRVSSSQNSAKKAYYETKIKQLAEEIAKKDEKIKELEDSIKKSKDENKNKKSDKIDERDARRLVSDIEHDLNKDRDFNRISIDRKDFDVEYDVRYRKSFDVSVYIRELDNESLEYLKKSYSNSRAIEYLLEDIRKEISRTDEFEDKDVYFSIIDKKNDKTIGSYDYKYDKDDLRGEIYR